MVPRVNSLEDLANYPAAGTANYGRSFGAFFPTTRRKLVDPGITRLFAKEPRQIVVFVA